MPLPPDVYPQNVMNTALQAQIDQKYQSGELRVQRQVAQQPTNPKLGWNIASFMDYIRGNKAVTQPFAGATHQDGGWFDQAASAIGGTEGFESRPYHGIFSSQRKPNDIFLKPGQFKEGGDNEEVSIGYGFNLSANKDARKVFETVLGIPGQRFDRIVNGEEGISPAEGARLRDYSIYQANAGLDRLVSKPLKDHQRAALVSMVYNFGPAGFAKTGVPAAINEGKSDADVASLIRSASANQKKLGNRRAAEANLYLGVSGASQFASLDVNGLKR